MATNWIQGDVKMVLSIISNTSASIAQQNLQQTDRTISRSVSRISTGQRVFSAKEDAAALSIGTGLKMDLASFHAAQTNASEATSMLQVADGGLGNVSQVLSRMSTLGAQAQSDALSDTERGYLDVEYQLLLQELDRISSETQFNGKSLLGGSNDVQILSQGANVSAANGFSAFQFNGDKVSNLDQFTVEYDPTVQLMRMTNTTTGQYQDVRVTSSPQPGFQDSYNFNNLGVKITLSSAFDSATAIGTPPIGVAPGPTAAETFQVQSVATPTAASLEFQIGPGVTTSDRVNLTLPVVNSSSLGLGTTSLSNLTNAQSAFEKIKAAIVSVSTAQASVGASMSQMEVVANGIDTAIQNSESARSALMDADIASESTQLASSQALLQGAIAVLAQSNQRPQMLLKILNS